MKITGRPSMRKYAGSAPYRSTISEIHFSIVRGSGVPHTESGFAVKVSVYTQTFIRVGRAASSSTRMLRLLGSLETGGHSVHDETNTSMPADSACATCRDTSAVSSVE